MLGNYRAASIGAKKMSQENRTVRWFYHSIPCIILFLLCWSLQISAGVYLISVAGLGTQLAMCYHLHNTDMMYAIMLIMGFTGLFVDRVLKYAGTLVKEKYGR